jgi:plastocyanin
MKKSRITVLAATFAVLFLGASALIHVLGCGDDKTPPVAKVETAKPVEAAKPAEPVKISEPVQAPEPVKVEPVKNEKAAEAAAPADAGVSGVVKIKGDVPRRKKIKMDADPKCAALHADDTPMTEEVVADKDGNVQWAFVYVKKGAPAKKPEGLKPAVIDQKGCHYEPHVLGLVVGQDLIIRNSDDLLHNIHALPFNNKEFNEGQPQKGMEAKKSFSTAEIMVKVKCDIHAWMGAWIGVLDHPYFAVTDAAGKYTINGLPDGKYTIEVWHEKYKPVTAEVDVKGATTTNFELTEKKE